MKNIHVLPTDKPTWLHKSLISGILRKSSSCINDMRQSQGMYIYITSDEEIKEGDWVMWLSQNRIIKCEDNSLRDRQDIVKKIILTTDQDLINDDVQAIDDEFLEWFVKNPSCEFAHLGFKSIIGDSETKRTWKIIIPKEESKQETENLKNFKKLVSDEISPAMIDFIKEKQEQNSDKKYSEEDMVNLIQFLSMNEEFNNYSSVSKDTAKYFLKQFKKKE